MKLEGESIQWFYGAEPNEVHVTTSFSFAQIERPATQETPHYWANLRVGQPHVKLYFKTSLSASFLYYNSLLHGYKCSMLHRLVFNLNILYSKQDHPQEKEMQRGKMIV